MARYVDIELLNAEEFENCTPYQAQEIIDEIPTADVVPSAEVEKLREELGEYKKHVDNDIIYVHRVRAEVAREISEEIEKIDEDTVSFQEFYGKIMKLKKKYTEESAE